MTTALRIDRDRIVSAEALARAQRRQAPRRCHRGSAVRGWNPEESRLKITISTRLNDGRPRVRTMFGNCVALATYLMTPGSLLAQTPPPPACVPGTSQIFASSSKATPAPGFQTYAVPAGVTSLLITANGGSGGRGNATNGTDFGPASFGAHIQATVPIAGPAILDVVVGWAGFDAAADSGSGGGGGGGSFVFVPGGTLLVAAGGGGGGNGGFAGGGNSPTAAGGNAQLGLVGGNGSGPLAGSGGSGGQGGSGGTGTVADGGGGGGYNSPGTAPGFPNDTFGHQIGLPGDASGGNGDDAAGAGGFGGGGGAAGPPAGGGGGYSGGGGGSDSNSGTLTPTGGGGGSLVAPGGFTDDRSVLNTTGDGSVTICVASSAVAAIPTIDSRGLALLALLIGILGALAAKRAASRVGG